MLAGALATLAALAALLGGTTALATHHVVLAGSLAGTLAALAALAGATAALTTHHVVLAGVAAALARVATRLARGLAGLLATLHLAALARVLAALEDAANGGVNTRRGLAGDVAGTTREAEN